MHKVWLLSLAGALLLALAPRPASALPDEHLLSAFGTGPNVPPAEYAQRRGGGRGGFSRGYGGYGRVARGYRGGYAYRGRRAVAVRGYRGYGYPMAGERSPLEVLRIMEAGVTMARIPTMEAHVRNTILMAGGHIEALTTEVLGSIGAVATTEALGCPITEAATGAVTEALGFPTIGVVSEAAGVGAETASDPNFENREHEACASRLKRSTLLGKSCFNGALAERSRAIPGCGQLCSFLVVPFLGIPARLL